MQSNVGVNEKQEPRPHVSATFLATKTMLCDEVYYQQESDWSLLMQNMSTK